MSGSEVQAAIAGLRAAFDQVAGCDLSLLTRPDLLAALDECETLTCQLPTLTYRLLARLQCEATPQQLGAHSWKEALRVRYRISTSEAHRRVTEAALLAPRQTVSGPSLPPTLPAVAAAAAHGLINAEHLEVIRKAVAKLPGWVDAATRTQFEVDLVRAATRVGPKELAATAELKLFLLDQDGPEPTDTQRAHQRGLSKSPQDADGMTEIRARLTPEATAVWEVIFAKYAAPGMCNPDDPEPCTSGTPTQTQIDNDHRSLAQRQHDALLAVGRIALMSGELGHLNGLPVSVIIRTTLQDLQSRAGLATTGAGTRLPITDVIRMAAHANHYLAVFDKATGSALDLFRARRTASPAQRIMLIARDGGCTKPGCTIGAYGSQAHHVTTDWAHGGHTNIDDLGLACPPHNRSVNTTPTGWTTRMNHHRQVEWLPPPHLDTGQNRLNYHHQPENLLPPDDQDTPTDTPTDTIDTPAGTDENTNAHSEATVSADKIEAEIRAGQPDTTETPADIHGDHVTDPPPDSEPTNNNPVAETEPDRNTTADDDEISAATTEATAPTNTHEFIDPQSDTAATDNHQIPDTAPDTAVSTAGPQEPGGPAPPTNQAA